MKNTSILIPLILIVCLGALIYLFVTALQQSDEDVFAGTTSRQTTLPAPRYTDEPTPQDMGTTTNIDDYFEDDAPARAEDNRPPVAPPTIDLDDAGDPAQNQAAANSASTTRTAPAPAPQTTTRKARYLVLAGSFTQKSGAQARVMKLRASGFPNARIGYMNGGNLAVAVADESNSLTDMMAVRDRVKAQNIEVRIYDRE